MRRCADAILVIVACALPCGCGAGGPDGAAGNGPSSPGRPRGLTVSVVAPARTGADLATAPDEADPILARVKALAARRASGRTPGPGAGAGEDGPSAAAAGTPAAPGETPETVAGPPPTLTDLLPPLRGGASPQEPAGPGVAGVFLLGAGDEVDVIVSGQPEFSGAVTVRADGTVALPTTGDIVHAGGGTEGALAEAVAGAISPRYVKARPAVSAVVLRSPRLVYHVFGAVRRPGLYEMPPGGLTVMDAVIRASAAPQAEPPLPGARGGAIGFEPVPGARYGAVRVVTPGDVASAVRTVDVARAMLGGPEALERVRAGEIVIVPASGGEWSEAGLDEKLGARSGAGGAPQRGAP